MSGFVSKISAAGSKGWTGLQSLWERDNKTQLTASNSGPPPEKTSLLSLALPSRHPRGSRLLSEDDDGVDSPPDDSRDAADPGDSPAITTTESLTPTTISTTSTTATSSPRFQPKAEKLMAPPAEWSTFSEDETDMWMRGDSAHLGILDTDKKKSTRESKRPSPRFKHKMAASPKGSDRKHAERERGFSPLGKLKGPSFGKLLDTECDEGEMGGGRSTSTGCENKVWADDDDDDDEAQWKMIEQRAVPKSK